MNEEVQRFIDAIPEDRRPLYDKLHALIMGMYPDAEVVIWYGVPTYRAKSGWVSLGPWKRGVSLYSGHPHLIDEFRAEHPDIKTGRGSINLKVTDEVPVPALKKVIKHAIEHPKDL